MSWFDHVIVGAGSAGCVLARRLTEDPNVTVLLLEAGPPDRKAEIAVPAAFPKLFKTEYDWDYSTTAQPGLADRSLYWPRGRTLGGSSSINAQMYVRGNAADYDSWAAAGNPGWSWPEVLAAFRRSECNSRGADEFHGGDGPLHVEDLRDPSPLTRAFLAAAEQSGIAPNPDLNGETQDGVSFSQVTQRRGRRASTSRAFLAPVRRRKNLTVRTGAHARRILLDGRRAVGVEYRGDVGTDVAEARQVILCGGAINSPQLLMLSGVGPRLDLEAHGIPVVHDLPAVGRHLQDHLSVPVIATTRGVDTLLSAERPVELARYLLARRGMLTSNVGEAMAFVRSGPEVPAPDLQLIFAPVQFIEHGLAPPPAHGVTCGVILLQPESEGEVVLASADPHAPARIEPRYLSDPAGRDLDVMVAGVRRAREVLGAPALAPVVAGEMWPGPDAASDTELAGFVAQRAETLYHPVGTCRMGPDPADAVVDPTLAVHGLQGLRVVDASVMPRIPRGNTNAPTIMIAERAAELMTAR